MQVLPVTDLPLFIQQQNAKAALKHQKKFKAIAMGWAQVAVGTNVGSGLENIEQALDRLG